jgi:hypothetical protein
MPLTDVHDSSSISTTEFSLPAKTTTAVPVAQTDAHIGACIIDLANMVAGDTYQITVYRRVNAGTLRPVYRAYPTGVQDQLFIVPTMSNLDAWDITMKRLAGADRTIAWSFTKVT